MFRDGGTTPTPFPSSTSLLRRLVNTFTPSKRIRPTAPSEGARKRELATPVTPLRVTAPASAQRRGAGGTTGGRKRGFQEEEIELKDFTQHITPKTSATSLARAPGYDFTPFTEHTYKKRRGQTEHTALSPPNFDFTSMSLNVSMKSPQSSSSTSGGGSVGAAGRRRRRYSDHFGNVRELRSMPYTGGGGRRLWSGGEGMDLEERENVAEEVPRKKRSGCLIVGEDTMRSLTDSSNSKQREGI